MDLWNDDELIEDAPSSRPTTSASASSSHSSDIPLFLPDADSDDDDNHTSDVAHNPPPENIDVDDIFNSALADDDVFNYEPISRPVLDRVAAEKNARAKYRSMPMPKLPQHEILPSSSPPPDEGVDGTGKSGDVKGKGKSNGAGEKKRRPMRLDEARLIGPTGFPQLIQDTKNFKIKGKGHEAQDLKRLLQVYQYWSHRMYPKSQFRDTVERIEKLCHSKRMHNQLGMWRDEAHGKAPAVAESDEEEDNTNLSQPDGDGEHPDGVPSRRASSSAPSSDAAIYAPSSPGAATRPPSSRGTSSAPDDLDDENLAAVLMEMEQEDARKKPTTSSAKGDTTGNWMEIDEDADDWGAFDDVHGFNDAATRSMLPDAAAKSLLSAGANVAIPDEDEEMWEMVREMEAETAQKSATVSAGIHSGGDMDSNMDSGTTNGDSSVLSNAGASESTEAQPSNVKNISTTEEALEDMYC